MLELLKSKLLEETTWIAITAIVTWIVQAVGTRYVAKFASNTWPKRLIRLAHGLLNTIDPEGNELKKDPKSDTLKSGIALLALLSIVGCSKPSQPVQSPTVSDLAVMVVSVTDTALTAYIDTAPESQLDTLDAVVARFKDAAEIVRRREDVCPVIPTIIDVAETIDCDGCSAMAKELKKLAGCK